MPRLDPVHRELGRFLRAHGIPRSAHLLAAVSGGSDSVALLHALLALGQRTAVAHVHHGLRGAEADREREFVAELCRELGVRFHAARVDARARDGRSPEARARALRYEALERLRSERGYRSIATAHQRDDQAETVLLRALRGTGPAGLAAIRPSLDGGRVLRPLLALRRAELVEYLSGRGLAWVRDSSNALPEIPRNRLRAEVVPVLEAIAPGAVANLAHLAELSARAADVERPLVAALLDRALGPGEGGLWLDPAALLALDGALRPTALAELARRAGLGARVSRGELARIEHFLAAARPGRTLTLPLGQVLFRDRERIWLGPAPGPRFPGPVMRSLAAGDALEFPERRIRLSWHDSPASPPHADPFRLPAQHGDRFTVRSASDADRVLFAGRRRRLKDVLASARWSRLERARALVVERAGEIVWIPGLPPCALPSAGARAGCEIRALRLSAPPRTC